MLKATGSAMLFNGLNFEPVERGLNFEPTSAEAVGTIMTWKTDEVDRGFTGLNFQPSARAAERGLKIQPLSYCYHDLRFCMLDVHGLKFQPMFEGEEGGARLC